MFSFVMDLTAARHICMSLLLSKQLDSLFRFRSDSHSEFLFKNQHLTCLRFACPEKVTTNLMLNPIRVAGLKCISRKAI